MPATTITIPRLAAVGAVVAAVLLVQLARGPREESSPVLPEVLPTSADDNASNAGAEGAAASSASPAAAKQRELEAMSETFRNTTFLIAIRDAGFTCNELLRVYGGLDDSAKWTVTCGEMLAYTVGVAGNGSLRVEPFLQYHDALGVPPVERVLPPEELPQPR